MRSQSPAESCHVMDADTLTRADIHLTGIRENGQLLAIGGLSILSATEGELKSMHTAQEARGRGLGRLLLDALLDHARAWGLTRVSLETGSAAAFAPARALYHAAGFHECPPFGSYGPDPLSVFMTRTL